MKTLNLELTLAEAVQIVMAIRRDIDTTLSIAGRGNDYYRNLAGVRDRIDGMLSSECSKEELDAVASKLCCEIWTDTPEFHEVIDSE